jgi:putative phosphoribosyl transferase
MFVDRADAGRRLASKVQHLRGEPVVVLGLPRGGVPVAAEIAAALDAPLDVVLVRKLGVPFQPELAMGAIGEDEVRVLDPDVLAAAQVSQTELATVEERQRSVLARRGAVLRQVRPRRRLDGCTAVVVDDGIATGATARAACRVARSLGAARVVLAVPVAPAGWTARLRGAADEYVSVASLPNFSSVGQFYRDFSQVSDDDVVRCLRSADPTSAWVNPGAGSEDVDPPVRDEDVLVAVDRVRLCGHLTVPPDAVGLVVFAHGSGSSRHSPRNRSVARHFHAARLGTLLLDLLTTDEEAHRGRVFDAELLGRRLAAVTGWIRSQPDTVGLPVGFLGVGTGAGAALWAAAEPDARIFPEGRPELVVIPGATHLFDEPATLDAAASAATSWFVGHLAPAGQAVG